MSNRLDICKCGRIITWDTEDDMAICKHCKTEYLIDCDSVLIYWLVEKIDQEKPYRTDAR